ncbi:MAG TPA: hypothetical protein VMF31_05580 [Solirubrobacterales bacterium]|nr:hypothetical protein [Solirubrobacterales bacterium]
MNIDGGANLLRLLVGIAAICFGLFCIVMSWGALGNLFADYQDSPVSTYLLVGGAEIALGLAFIVTGYFALPRGPR